jgi:hypothetical protein
MKSAEIASLVKAEVEPLPDTIYGPRYRVSAFLSDGTYLPCVVVQSKRKQTDLAERRFEQLKKQPDHYRPVLEVFVAAGSRVADHDISRVAISPHAWPLATLRQIHGETTMGWTAFVVEMSDGRRFSYGTSFRFEFFDLPDGYSFNDIKTIHSGMIHSDAEGTKPFSSSAMPGIKCFREKPFFTCYIDGLDG